MSVSARNSFRAAHPWVGLGLFLAVCLAAGGIGGAATGSSVSTWYPTLAKPAWNPPAWVFGPVWTTLYLMMGVAAWRVWRAHSRGASGALGLFGVQLVLNTLWSIVFFGLRAPGPAFFELLLLWLAILATGLRFYRLDRVAGALMAPYLAWVTFAGVLNYTIWQLNR
jgi:tryptophan-rich sensory protein